MISCLLIHVARNSQGVAANVESEISGESIQIGRGAACKIHLPDHRVHLLHATLRRSEDGTLYIDGEKDVVMNINGFIEQSAALSPGTKFVIGPYMLTVAPDDRGHDIALLVEMPQSQEAKEASHATPVTLESLGLSKRRMSWIAAVSMILLFLLPPLLPSTSAKLDKWQAGLPVTLTGSWNPGALSGGHSMFGSQCSVCHRQAFTAITNEVCEDCHARLKPHRGKNTASSNHKKYMGCIDCHTDHKGGKGLVRRDPSRCVICHGDIKKLKTDAKQDNVHSFDVDHPAFKLSVQSGEQIIRASKPLPAENSGLKFSHKVHLDKQGVSTPLGDMVMECSDCHKLDEAGTRFKPLTMKASCQQSRCHELEFSEPLEGNVPHGDERTVLDRMRRLYTKWLGDDPANKAECKNFGGAGNIVKCADGLAMKNAGSTLFGPRNEECGECHTINATSDKEVPWKMARVHINRDWLPDATFSHRKHDTMVCTACHDKTNSTSSADIAMPGIDKCRECHTGKDDEPGKIMTKCDSCHRFHHGMNLNLEPMQ